MDLSKVSELELRQKVKPINDRMDAIDAEIDQLEEVDQARVAAVLRPIRDRLDAVRNELVTAREAEQEKASAALKPLQDERDKLDAQLRELLGEDRIIEGTCHLTGLPIFSDDSTEVFTALACVVNAERAAA